VSAPKLNPATVTDDVLLAAAIDQVIKAEDDGHCREIVERQGTLRGLVDGATWDLYL
jgi:hypothetical protein